jgi:hypothetical protein
MSRINRDRALSWPAKHAENFPIQEEIVPSLSVDRGAFSSPREGVIALPARGTAGRQPSIRCPSLFHRMSWVGQKESRTAAVMQPYAIS